MTIPNEVQETVLNGVSVTRLGQTVAAIQQNPALAQFRFRARNQWKQGAQSKATISGFHGTCQELRHEVPFVLEADEPPVLLGQDTAASAGEYVLAGLSACLTGTLAYHAAARGLKIEAIRSEYEGDVDLHGFLDLDPEVRNGFREIRVKLQVKGDVDEATARELLRKSPIYDTLANPVRIQVEVEKI